VNADRAVAAAFHGDAVRSRYRQNLRHKQRRKEVSLEPMKIHKCITTPLFYHPLDDVTDISIGHLDV
jgi:hypothetical protein